MRSLSRVQHGDTSFRSVWRQGLEESAFLKLQAFFLGESGQTHSVFKREAVHPGFRALLLCCKSSPVFSVEVGGLAGHWLQENNPSLKSGSPDPEAIASWDEGTEPSILHPAEERSSHHSIALTFLSNLLNKMFLLKNRAGMWGGFAVPQGKAKKKEGEAC
ncbi:hypothetical protein HispidOSU_017749 [Sigmodon hispidus]